MFHNSTLAVIFTLVFAGSVFSLVSLQNANSVPAAQDNSGEITISSISFSQDEGSSETSYWRGFVEKQAGAEFSGEQHEQDVLYFPALDEEASAAAVIVAHFTDYPSINLPSISPASGTYTKSSITITFTTSVNANCRWSLNSNDAYASMTGDCTGDGTTSQSCTATGLVEGSEVVYVDCASSSTGHDNSGNTGITYNVDLTDPSHACDNCPSSGTDNTPTFRVSATDSGAGMKAANGECRISTSDVSWSLIGSGGNCTYVSGSLWDCTGTTASCGSNNYYVSCRDDWSKYEGGVGNEPSGSNNLNIPAYTLNCNPPNAPSGMTIDINKASPLNSVSGGAVINWNDQSTDETGFKLERKTNQGAFSQVAAPGANTESYSDTDINADTTYTYRVRATNGNGDSDYAAAVSINTLDRNSSVFTFTADADPSNDAVDLNWTTQNRYVGSATFSNSCTQWDAMYIPEEASQLTSDFVYCVNQTSFDKSRSDLSFIRTSGYSAGTVAYTGVAHWRNRQFLTQLWDQQNPPKVGIFTADTANDGNVWSGTGQWQSIASNGECLGIAIDANYLYCNADLSGQSSSSYPSETLQASSGRSGVVTRYLIADSGLTADGWFYVNGGSFGEGIAAKNGILYVGGSDAFNDMTVDKIRVYDVSRWAAGNVEWDERPYKLTTIDTGAQISNFDILFTDDSYLYVLANDGTTVHKYRAVERAAFERATSSSGPYQDINGTTQDFTAADNTDITSLAGWTKDVADGSIYTIRQNRLRMSHPASAPNEARDNAQYDLGQVLTNNLLIEFDVNVDNSDNWDFMFVVSQTNGISGGSNAVWSAINNESYRVSSGGVWNTLKTGLVVGNRYSFKVLIDQKKEKVKYYINDIFLSELDYHVAATSGIRYINFGNYGYGSVDTNWHVDNFKVKSLYAYAYEDTNAGTGLDTTAPDQVTGLSVTGSTTTTCDLGWSAPSDNGNTYYYTMTAFDERGNESNFVKNHSVERWSVSTIPDSWNGLSNASAAKDADSMFGNYSAKVTPTSSAGYLRWQDNSISGLLSGKLLKISFWYKQGASGSTTANVRYRNNNGNSGTAGQVTTGREWQYKEFVYQSVAPGTTPIIDLEPDTTGSNKPTLFDNVKMQVVESPTVTTGISSYTVTGSGSGNPSGTTVTRTGLVSNTSYSYSVSANDGAGNTGTASSNATCITLPSAPTWPGTAVAGSACGSTIGDATPTLTGNSIGSGVASHTHSDWAICNTNSAPTGEPSSCPGGAAASSANDSSNKESWTPGSSLGDGTYYAFVRYNNSSGGTGGDSAYSASCSFTVDLGAPTLSVDYNSTYPLNSGLGAMILSWDDQSTESSYKVFRSTDSAAFTQVATPAQNSTSYNDLDLNDNTTYYYKVAAVYAESDANSNADSNITIDRSGPAPPSLTLTPQAGSNRIDANWSVPDDNSSNVKLFDGNVVAYWRFEEGSGSVALDSTTNDYNGTIIGATYTNGRMGKALDFNGSGAVVTTPSLGLSGQTHITISAWAKLDDTISTTLPAIISDGGSIENGIHLSGGSYNSILLKGDSSLTDQGVTAAPSGFDPYSWNHYAGVSNAGGLFLYLNGKLVGSNTSDFTNINIAADMEIGHAKGSSARYWKGLIDEVMVTKSPLGAGDVNSLYRAGVIRYDLNRATSLDGTYSLVVDNADFNSYNDTGATDTTAPTTPANAGVSGPASSSLNVDWNASTDSGNTYYYFVDALDDQGNESNLLFNSGLEVDTGKNYGVGNATAGDGFADGWSNNVTDSWSLDSSDKISGNTSWKVTSSAGDHYPNVLQRFQNHRITPLIGKTVVFTAWVKPLSTASGPVMISFDRYDGATWTYSAGTGESSSGTSWQKLTATYTVPAGTTLLDARITVENNSSANTTGKTIHIDEAKLVVVESAAITTGLKQYWVNCVSGGSCASGSDAVDKVVSGSTTTTVSSLDANVSYCFTVLATDNADNNSSATSQQCGFTLANVPGSPTVTNATASTLDVDVNPNSNPAATQFAIYDANASQWVQANGSLGVSEVWQTDSQWGTVTVTGLTVNTQHCFSVKARNGNLVETALGALACGSTSGESVDDLVATAQADKARNSSLGRITLAWSDVSGETNYTLYRSTDGTTYTTVGTIAQNSTSYNDDNLGDNTLYYYIMQANYGGGDLNGNTATAFTPDRTAPSNSGDLSGSYALNQVDLSWSKGTDNNSAQAALDYNVLRSTTAIDNNASYSVLAKLDDSNSYSDTTGTDSANPDVPSISSVNADSNSQLSVSWGSVGDNATTYYYKAGVIDEQANDSNTNSVTVSALSGISKYWVANVTNSSVDINSGATSFTAASLDTNTSYCFTVSAADNADNNSSASAQSCQFTLSTVPKISSVSCGSNSCTVTVDLNSNPIGTDFNVGIVNAAPGGSDSGWVKSDSQPDTYTDSGLSAGTEYCYVVQARNGSLVGTAVSAQVCGTTGISGVTDLSATPQSKDLNTTDSGVDLSWSDTSGETGYTVYRGTDGTVYSTLGSIAANSSSYSDSGTSDNTLYYYIVQANSAGGDVNSNVATAFTPDRTAPGAFTLTPAANNPNNRVDLNWTVPTDNNTSSGNMDYNVSRSTDNASFSVVAQQTGTTIYNDSGATDTNSPSTPPNPGVSGAKPASLNLDWNASADGGSTYYHRITAIDQQRNWRNSNSASSTVTTGIKQYWVNCVSGGTCIAGFDAKDKAVSGATTTSVGGLDANTSYCFTVLATDNADNNSSATSQRCAFTLAKIPGITSVSCGIDNCSIAFDLNGNPVATQYLIDETTGNTGGTDSNWSTAASPYTDSGLNPGAQYCYRVKARNHDLVETPFTAPAQCGTTGDAFVKTTTDVNGFFEPSSTGESSFVGAWQSIDANVHLSCTSASGTFQHKEMGSAPGSNTEWTDFDDGADANVSHNNFTLDAVNDQLALDSGASGDVNIIIHSNGTTVKWDHFSAWIEKSPEVRARVRARASDSRSGLGSASWSVWHQADNWFMSVPDSNWVQFNVDFNNTKPSNSLNFARLKQVFIDYVEKTDVDYCTSTQYRRDTDASDSISFSAWQEYDQNILFNQDGNYALEFYSTSTSGNQEPNQRVLVLIDRIPAQILLSQSICSGINDSSSFNVSWGEVSTNSGIFQYEVYLSTTKDFKRKKLVSTSSSAEATQVDLSTHSPQFCGDGKCSVGEFCPQDSFGCPSGQVCSSGCEAKTTIDATAGTIGDGVCAFGENDTTADSWCQSQTGDASSACISGCVPTGDSVFSSQTVWSRNPSSTTNSCGDGVCGESEFCPLDNGACDNGYVCENGCIFDAYGNTCGDGICGSFENCASDDSVCGTGFACISGCVPTVVPEGAPGTFQLTAAGSSSGTCGDGYCDASESCPLDNRYCSTNVGNGAVCSSGCQTLADLGSITYSCGDGVCDFGENCSLDSTACGGDPAVTKVACINGCTPTNDQRAFDTNLAQFDSYKGSLDGNFFVRVEYTDLGGARGISNAISCEIDSESPFRIPNDGRAIVKTLQNTWGDINLSFGSGIFGADNNVAVDANTSAPTFTGGNLLQAYNFKVPTGKHNFSSTRPRLTLDINVLALNCYNGTGSAPLYSCTAADLNKVSIYDYNETTETWSKVPSTVDVANLKVYADLNHFSTYGQGEDNEAPTVTLESPSNGASITDTKPDFQASPSESVSNCYLQVDDSSGFGSPFSDLDGVDVGTDCDYADSEYTTAFSEGTTIYWRMKATDDANNAGSYGTAFSFSVASSAVCGNAVCESGENKNNCSADCGSPGTGAVCGNAVCESGENKNNCPADCGTSLEDACTEGEVRQCGTCGSQTCSNGLWETCDEPPVCGSADLAIAAVSADAKVVYESSADIVVNVQNLGEDVSQSFGVGAEQQGPYNDTKTINGLASGDATSVLFTVPWRNSNAGKTVDYLITVDPDNVVAESDESNNQRTVIIEFGAEEECGNLIDDDFDGLIDEGCGLPNLKITGISVGKPVFVDSELVEVDFNVTIETEFENVDTEFAVSYFKDSLETSSRITVELIGSIQVGQEVKLLFVYTAPIGEVFRFDAPAETNFVERAFFAGLTNFYVEVDSGDSVSEVDEADNVVILNIQNLVPDLTITDFTIPASSLVGGSFVVSATIFNAGEASAEEGAYSVTAFVDGIASATVPGELVEKDGEWNAVLTLSGLSEGEHTITIMVDSLEEIAESNETNNSVEGQHDVIGSLDELYTYPVFVDREPVIAGVWNPFAENYSHSFRVPGTGFQSQFLRLTGLSAQAAFEIYFLGEGFPEKNNYVLQALRDGNQFNEKNFSVIASDQESVMALVNDTTISWVLNPRFLKLMDYQRLNELTFVWWRLFSEQ